MKRKTPMMKRWFALLLAGLLMVAPAVLAEEEDGAGFGTFFQPEGVELCEVEDAGSLSVPDGLLNAVQGEGKSVTIDPTYPRVEAQYDRQTLHVQAILETSDGSGLRVRLDGVAFYQGNDLIELWQAWPEATTYQLMPLAVQELRDDLATLKELTDSFQFQDSSQSQEERL